MVIGMIYYGKHRIRKMIYIIYKNGGIGKK